MNQALQADVIQFVLTMLVILGVSALVAYAFFLIEESKEKIRHLVYRWVHRTNDY